MTLRRSKLSRKMLAWLLCAVLLPVQSLLPASAAVVQVSLRCAGMSTAAPACAEMWASAADGVSAAHAPRQSVLPCCRHAHGPCPMMMGMGAMTTTTRINAGGVRGRSPSVATTLSAPGCQVSVTALTAERPAALTDAQGHLLLTLTALPASCSHLATSFPQAAPAPLRAASLARPLPCLPRAHGLRAPPAAC